MHVPGKLASARVAAGRFHGSLAPWGKRPDQTAEHRRGGRMGEEDRVFAKCAWRLIPLMMLLYVVNYIDRVNVGFAALTMNRDLGFSPAIFGFGAGLFFLGYLLFQVPMSVTLERVGARRSIFAILIIWGAISAGTALVQGPHSFYALRFL